MLATNYAQGDNIVRLKLNAAGTDVVEKSTLASGFSDPVNLLVAPDGAIFVAEHSNAGDSFAQISVLEPIALACPKPGSPNVDSDGDGFLDSDEAANGVDFCNPAETPRDFDGDKLSDLLDPDDDNDGVPDAADRFQLDASNGAATAIPWVQAFNQSDSGGWFGSGFGGIQLSSKGGGPLAGQISAGGAGGYLSITATDGTSPGRREHPAQRHPAGLHAERPVRGSRDRLQPVPRRRDRQRERRHLLRPGRGQLRPAGRARQRRHPGDRARHRAGRHLHPPRRPGSALWHRERAADAQRRPRDQPGARALPARRRLGADHRRPDRPGRLVRLAGRRRPGDHQGREREAVDHLHLRRLRDRRRHRGAHDRPRAADRPQDPDHPDQPQAADRGKGGKVKLTIGQMRINQRISPAAIRRVATLEAFLEGRPAPRFPTAQPAKFKLTIAQMAINQRIAQAAVRRVDALAARLAGRKPATPRPSSGNAKFTLTATQMLINQRISQAAVRRVNALQAQVDAGARLP